MYPHKILVREKYIQVLQPFDPSSSGKSRHHFRRSTSWYELDSTPSNLIEKESNAISDDDIWPSPLAKDNPCSTELSGPHEPSRDKGTSRSSPKSDKGKGKMPEYEVDHPDNSDLDASARSLDSDFGVPIMQTPRVKKALISENEKLCRSSRAKNPATRYAYNEYMVHHYAFTIKVAVEQEPESPSLHQRLEGEELNYHA